MSSTQLHFLRLNFPTNMIDRRSRSTEKTLITKDVNTHIILTVIKSLFEKFLGIRKTGEFVPRADGWCSDSDNEIDFRFPFAGASSRGGGIEQCSISQPRDEMHSYSPSTQALLRMLLLLLLPSHAMSQRDANTLEGVTASALLD